MLEEVSIPELPKIEPSKALLPSGDPLRRFILNQAIPRRCINPTIKLPNHRIVKPPKNLDLELY